MTYTGDSPHMHTQQDECLDTLGVEEQTQFQQQILDLHMHLLTVLLVAHRAR